VIPGLRVTNLQRHPEGFWECDVHLNGEHVHADLRNGSWQIAHGTSRREVHPLVARELADRVKRAERREAVPA
jgi:hypothetical protein